MAHCKPLEAAWDLRVWHVCGWLRWLCFADIAHVTPAHATSLGSVGNVSAAVLPRRNQAPQRKRKCIRFLCFKCYPKFSERYTWRLGTAISISQDVQFYCGSDCEDLWLRVRFSHVWKNLKMSWHAGCPVKLHSFLWSTQNLLNLKLAADCASGGTAVVAQAERHVLISFAVFESCHFSCCFSSMCLFCGPDW